MFGMENQKEYIFQPKLKLVFLVKLKKQKKTDKTEHSLLWALSCADLVSQKLKKNGYVTTRKSHLQSSI